MSFFLFGQHVAEAVVFSRDIVLVFNQCVITDEGDAVLWSYNLRLFPCWLLARSLVEPSELCGGIPFMRPFQIKALALNWALSAHALLCAGPVWVFTWTTNIVKCMKRGDLGLAGSFSESSINFEKIEHYLFIQLKLNLLIFYRRFCHIIPLCGLSLLVKFTAAQQGLKLKQDHEPACRTFCLHDSVLAACVFIKYEVYGEQPPYWDEDRCRPAHASLPSWPPSIPALWGNSLHVWTEPQIFLPIRWPTQFPAGPTKGHVQAQTNLSLYIHKTSLPLISKDIFHLHSDCKTDIRRKEKHTKYSEHFFIFHSFSVDQLIY